MGCPLAEDNLRPWSGGASSMAQCPGMDLYFSSEMQEIAGPVSTRKTVSEPSMVPERCGLVSMTSGGVMAKREQTYSSALTTGFLQGVLLNALVLALVDVGTLGSANCQKALSNGFPDGSPLSFACGVSLEISA